MCYDLAMTQSEFETLRSELRAFRAEIESRLASLQADIYKHLMRLEAKIDEKPGAMVIYQAALTMMTGMFAMLVGGVILLKTLGIS
jgi:hypothetical protein